MAKKLTIEVYEDTQDAGDAVLMREDGAVSFVSGQNLRDIAAAYPAIVWSDAVGVKLLARECQGTYLGKLEVVTDVTEEEVPQVLSDYKARGADAVVAFQGQKAYRAAVAHAMLCVRDASKLDALLQKSAPYLAKGPAIFREALETVDEARQLQVQAMRQLLLANETVVRALQVILAGEPGAAHAAVGTLMDGMGVPATGCPCCGGKEDHFAQNKDTEPAQGVHVPGSTSIN